MRLQLILGHRNKMKKEAMKVVSIIFVTISLPFSISSHVQINLHSLLYRKNLTEERAAICEIGY